MPNKMRRVVVPFAAFILLVAAVGAAPPDADAPSKGRRVVIYAGSAEIHADRLEAKWDGNGKIRLVLGAEGGAVVEARWRPAEGDLEGRAARHLADGFRLTARSIVLEAKAEEAGGGPMPIEAPVAIAATGAMRLEGATFSLTCERILFARGSRRVEIEGVRGLRLDPGLKRKLPPVSLRTERLELEVDDLGLDEPWEVVFSHPGGIRASLDGARVRVGTLVLQLRP